MITLHLGDITTDTEAVAIVNAANESLLGGGGVDGAIHRAAGPSLLEECRAVGRCMTGDAKITGAGDLAAQHVIHAVGPVWRGGGLGEPELLEAVYRRTITLADSSHCPVVALPSISTGAYGFPVERAAPIAIATVREEMLRHPGVRKARFWLFDERTLRRVPRGLGTPGLTSPGRAGATLKACTPAAPRSSPRWGLPPTGPGCSTSSSQPAWTARASTARTGRTRTCAAAPSSCARPPSGPAAPSPCCSICRARRSASRPTRSSAGWSRATGSCFCGNGDVSDPDVVRVAFDDFCGLVTDRSEIVIGDGVPRLMTESVSDGPRGRARPLPRRAAAQQGHQRHVRPPHAPGHHREGHGRPRRRRRDGRRLRRAVVRAQRHRHDPARRPARGAAVARAGHREDREDRGLRAPRRHPRRVARRDGRAGRLRRGGRVRARAAHAEGHDLPRHPGRQARHHRDADVRVDDHPARADARGGRRTSPTRSSTAPPR